MAGTMAWLTTIPEEYSIQETFGDRYQTLAEEHYIEMARRSTESRSPPTNATGTVTPATGITEPSTTEKPPAVDGNGVNTDNTSDSSVVSTPPTGTKENVSPKKNAATPSNGVQTDNAASPSSLSTPPTSAEKNTPTKNTTAESTVTENGTESGAMKTSGPSKTTKASNKRKTAADAHTHETATTSKRFKTPQNAENSIDGDVVNAADSSGPPTPASGSAEEIAALNGAGLDTNAMAGPSRPNRKSKKRKAATNAGDDDTVKKSPVKKKLKAEKGLRPMAEIWKEYEENKKREAEEAAKQEESIQKIETADDANEADEASNGQNTMINDSSANDHARELDDADANTPETVTNDNEADEAVKTTTEPSTKNAGKRKADELTPIEPETPKRVRRKTAKASDAAPTKPRKITSKATKTTPLQPDTPPPPPSPAALSIALRAKLIQVNTFINAHPGTDFSRTANSDPEALTLSETTLQGVAQTMYTQYDLAAPAEQSQYPLLELEDLVLSRGEDGEDGIKWPVTLEILAVSALEARVQEKVQGHGMQGVNLLKVEIEMSLEREEGVVTGATGWRVFEQVERLLDAVEDVEVREAEEVGVERVLGVCPRPMEVV